MTEKKRKDGWGSVKVIWFVFRMTRFMWHVQCWEYFLLALPQPSYLSFKLGFLVVRFICFGLHCNSTFGALLQDQKKFHEQLSTEQETLFGSRPSPARPLSTKKVLGPRANGANGIPNRRLSLNAHQNGTRSINKDGKRDNMMRPVAPLNYVAISKEEDVASCISGTEPLPSTP